MARARNDRGSRGGSKGGSRTVVASARKGPLSLNVVLTAVVVAVALIVGAVVLLTQRGSDAAAAEGGHQLSSAPGSAVEIVEYVDFQCPACYSYYTNVTKAIEDEYDGRINFTVRNYPLPMHPLAVPAARAAEAAAEQGKYSEFYHQLYDTWQSWAAQSDGSPTTDPAAAQAHFTSIATGLGLDATKFAADQSSATVQGRIDADESAGNALGVSSTPTIFVNGEKFVAAGQSWPEVKEQLTDLIDARLAG